MTTGFPPIGGFATPLQNYPGLPSGFPSLGDWQTPSPGGFPAAIPSWQGASPADGAPPATVGVQLQGYMDPNSPLMQMAQTQAKQAANARGLLNSSMATQAGQQAMFAAALPMAQQDASAYAAERQSAIGFGNSATLQAQQAQYTQELNTQKYASDSALQDARLTHDRWLNEQNQAIERQRLANAAQQAQQESAKDFSAFANSDFTKAFQDIVTDPNMTQAARDAALETLRNNFARQMGYSNALLGLNVPW